MFKHLVAAGLIAVAFGCGRPAAPLPAEAPAPAATNGTASPESGASVEQTLQELTQAVRKYSLEQRRVPRSLDELVANGYLRRVPDAPAGQHFRISRNLQVYLASK